MSMLLVLGGFILNNFKKVAFLKLGLVDKWDFFIIVAVSGFAKIRFLDGISLLQTA